MDDVTIARVLHVLAVVLWIGGVGMITTVLFPILRRLPDGAQRLALFEAIEHRFGLQARFTVLLAGLTGLYMLVRLDAWSRFTRPDFWWMHAMVLVWLLFAAVLFVLEPLVLHRGFTRRAHTHPVATFRVVHLLHWVMLVLSLVTVAGAVAGSHGLRLFG